MTGGFESGTGVRPTVRQGLRLGGSEVLRGSSLISGPRSLSAPVSPGLTVGQSPGREEVCASGTVTRAV